MGTAPAASGGVQPQVVPQQPQVANPNQQQQPMNPNQAQQPRNPNQGQQQKNPNPTQQQKNTGQQQGQQPRNPNQGQSLPPGFATGTQGFKGPPPAFSRPPQAQPAPGLPGWMQPTTQVAPPATWGPQAAQPPVQQMPQSQPMQQPYQQAPKQQEKKPQGQRKGQWKEKPKQQQQQTLPTTATTPSPSTSQTNISQEPSRPPSAQSSTGTVAKQLDQMKVSPTQASQFKIESSPDGKVYEGTRGRKVNLEVNYLQLLVKNMIPEAFHYDVEFEPDVPKKMLPRALDTFMATHFKDIYFAFDGRKNFYTNKLLAVKGETLEGQYEKEVEATLGDRSKRFKVKVQFATRINMSVLKDYKQPKYQNNNQPSQAIQCLDIILRTVFKQLTSNNRAVAVGRALYFAPDRPIDLTEGMELWLGLFQSAVLGRKSLYLNVDVAHKAFPSAISLLQVLKNFTRDGRVPNVVDEYVGKTLHEYLKMLSIGYRVGDQPVKTFGYNGLVKPASEATFVDDDGKKMTVQQYFERVKGIRLQYPNHPCLHVGSKVRNIYLPLEFCEIPAGQATNKKVTPNCVAKMIRFSATSTDDRKRKIYDLLNKINYQDMKGEVRGFGIDVDKKFQNVEGRVIDPPKIKYTDCNVMPRNGVWNGGKFLQTQGQPIKWAVINCDNRTSIQSIMTLKQNILKEAFKQGMSLAQSKGDEDYFSLNMSRGRGTEAEELLQKCQKQGYKLVIVIIIDFNDCYAKIKQAAELKVGILTQCIKANTIYRMGNGNPMMTIGNILLKVNAKLNGRNHEVIEASYNAFNKHQTKDGVMFVGADVTHPSPDQRDIPSVVGVAASYDDVGFRYQCAWRLQDPKKEMIEDLENILVEQLSFYKARNMKLPGKLMYYRDGVSDGQFNQVD